MLFRSCASEIDLGGTKIEAIALDRDGGERAKLRRPSPRGDYPGTLAAIAKLVGDVESAAGVGRSPVGVGMPGAISPATGLVKNANSTWLNGQPFDKDLAVALGRPLRLANDADCLAISEASDEPPGQLPWWSSALFSAPVWAAGSWWRAGSSRAPMRLPGNGAITRCPARPTMSGRALLAIAAGSAASKPGFQALRFAPGP